MSNFDKFIKAIEREDLKEVKKLCNKSFIKERYSCGGRTALHCASLNNDRGDIAQYLVGEGWNMEAEDISGLRSIHLAAARGKVGVLKVLIERGCGLRGLTKYGQSASDLALERGNNNCVEIIKRAETAAAERPYKEALELVNNTSLSKIMDPETGKTLLDQLVSKNDPRIIAAINSKPVKDNEIIEWKKLKKEGHDPRSTRLLQECLLARCIYQSHENGIYDLCTAAVVNKVSVFMKRSVLETAVEYKVLAYSVKNILCRLENEDESWKIAEDMAKNNDDKRTVKAIKNRRKFLKIKEKEGYDRIKIAVYENDADMIEYIMNKESIKNEQEDKKGGEALSMSYSRDNMECVKSLQNNKVNVNIFDKMRQTPLHMAIYNRRQEHSEYLVNNMENIENEDFMSFTVLERSVMNDCEDICKNILTKGARCDKYVKFESKWLRTDPDLGMILYNTPHLRLTEFETIFTLCYKVNKTVYASLLCKLDRRTINLTDGDNNTLLHLCATSLNIKLCTFLIQKSAFVDEMNKKQRTPLLELLIQNDKNRENNEDFIKTVKMLIEGGASVNVKDSEQFDVLKIASKYNNEELLLTLIKQKETLQHVEFSHFTEWLNKKYYIFITEVSPLINKSLREQWISKHMIERCLQDENLVVTKSLYHSAACNVQTDVIEAILLKAALKADMKLFKEMIIYDIDPDTTLDDGESLISLLIKERKKKFIVQIINSRHRELLLEKSDKENKLPLHVCIERECWEVIDSLIADTKSVNKEDNDDHTPLSMLLTKISEKEDEELSIALMGYVKHLILKSADIFKVNKNNKTVITFCKKPRAKLEIESYFRQHQKVISVPQVIQVSTPEQTNREQQRGATANPICHICEDEPRDCALNCGHIFGMNCAERVFECFTCRRPITDRIKLYQ